MDILLLPVKNRAWFKPCKSSSRGPWLQDIAELCKMTSLLPLGVEFKSQGQHCYTFLNCCHPSCKVSASLPTPQLLSGLTSAICKSGFYLEDTTSSGRPNEPPFGDSKLNSCVIQSKAILIHLLPVCSKHSICKRTSQRRV